MIALAMFGMNHLAFQFKNRRRLLMLECGSTSNIVNQVGGVSRCHGCV